MGDQKQTKEHPCEGLSDIYLMYFDEARGHVPLFIYPEKKFTKLRENKTFMRPIKYHPIWFLTVNEQEALDHVDLEFKGYVFFGKKFLTKSKRKKRRAGMEEDTPETIIMIVSLPNDIEIFGDDFIRLLVKKIKQQFGDRLYQLIEYEISKYDVIKTPKIRQIIKEGEKIKNELNDLITNTCREFFSSVIQQTDISSFKQQKALSFLALKGIDVSHLISDEGSSTFSNVKLFDPSKKISESLKLKLPFIISNIEITPNSHELEIIILNNTDDEKQDLIVKITHVKEFFEKEVMNQCVDLWFPKEELVFISPITPQVSEYILVLIDQETNRRVLSQKIDISTLGNKEEKI
ncbi:MAG: hypothetical protein ACTSR7_08205 [Promethearchaeota archaeon]